jgi:endonuclease G
MAPRRNEYNGPSEEDLREAQSLLNVFFGLNRQAQVGIIVFLLIVGAFAAVAYYRAHHSQAGGPIAGSPQMLLGNPSNATPDPFNRDNYLMLKPNYALSYNDSRGTPNWVSWRVTEADLGDAPRKPEFDPDDTLPLGLDRVTSHDYTGSGFDRGHMCPHGDRSADVEMSFSTFVMTNIVPQAPNLNRKAWAQLEVYCRELVSRGHQHLYISAGPNGKGGVGSQGYRDLIGHDHVTTPSECWKIVLMVPEEGGEDDLAKINPATRVIAVEMPNNENAVSEEWDGFRTSVANVEERTGLHFFGRLTPSVAQALKLKVDRTPIPPPRPLTHFKD